MTLYLETPGAKAPFPPRPLRGPAGPRFHEAFFRHLVRQPAPVFNAPLSREHSSLSCRTGGHARSRNYRR